MYYTRFKKKCQTKTEQNIEQSNDVTQCLICWESENNNNKITNMKNITMFSSNCDCDCYFHLQCFFDWVKKTPTCPICRNVLTINNELLEIYKFGSRPYYKITLFFKAIVNFTYKILQMIIKYISMLFLLYVSINTIRHIINQYKFDLIN